jgi:large subunit ribosomal protein L46
MAYVYPSSPLDQSTNTSQAASRILSQSGGPNMNTWLVGHVPIGHHQLEYTKRARSDSGPTEHGAKTFFLKARIMAGQVNLKENKLGLKDFKWLAKEELQKEVDEGYWKSVKNMLAER